jgi:predicted RND superfamily exporter protein
VDTDPENMLSEDEAVRRFHHEVKSTFDLHDVVVLGIVNDTHPDGVFNPQTLKKVSELTRFAERLVDDDDPQKRVITQDVIAPSTVDSIEQAGMGQVRFEWLMKTPPTTREDALRIRDAAMGNPLLKGTLVSEDGKALAIYLPITSKDFAYQVRRRLLEKIEGDEGDEHYYITGLPVAEDTFGVEMFIQMAVSAPLAMLAIFLLMLFFFRNLRLIISPLIIAMASVICTMGLLIATGNTVHIMSSMIPIFLMPIAVVDSIHILSEFFDRYPKNRNREKTLQKVMDHLFTPMLYTSLTSSAGFASLALTPIPPVRVFGLFVAFGIMLAWLLTIVFIPAYVMLLKAKTLDNFGAIGPRREGKGNGALLARVLPWMGSFTYRNSKALLALSLVVLAVAGFGISKIQINDNPVKWFQKKHAIRVADRVLNHHFGGTYEAYLVLQNAQKDLNVAQIAELLKKELKPAFTEQSVQVADQSIRLIDEIVSQSTSPAIFWDTLADAWETVMDEAPEASYDFWVDTWEIVERVRNRNQIFKRPDVLEFVSALQRHLSKNRVVGKSNSVSDVVKKVHMELFEGQQDAYRIPETVNAVAQTLISFQNSHKPDDLWHLVTPDYSRANIWVQLKNGDNKDMESTVKAVDEFLAANPPPVDLQHQWAGLTYLNVVWQDKMVNGMLKSFLSSFAVVFVMMSVLFRSVLWGALAMVPLSVTIALIYGIIGIIGKDYDMPVAVLSSLTLGLAVDFAIHFLERSRAIYQETRSWKAAVEPLFEEPARAITRNVIVIAIGFTPLLLAPLVPYQTVGVFLASIMAISGVGTLLLLPALIKMLRKSLFGQRHKLLFQTR